VGGEVEWYSQYEQITLHSSPVRLTYNYEPKVVLCITPLFGWRGGRCTPNHALLHAPNQGYQHLVWFAKHERNST